MKPEISVFELQQSIWKKLSYVKWYYFRFYSFLISLKIANSKEYSYHEYVIYPFLISIILLIMH